MLRFLLEIWDAKCYFLDNEEAAPDGIIDPAGTTMSIDSKKTNGKDIFVIVKGETEDDKAMLIVRTSNASGGEVGGEETAIFKITSSNGMGSDFVCTLIVVPLEVPNISKILMERLNFLKWRILMLE